MGGEWQRGVVVNTLHPDVTLKFRTKSCCILKNGLNPEEGPEAGHVKGRTSEIGCS